MIYFFFSLPRLCLLFFLPPNPPPENPVSSPLTALADYHLKFLPAIATRPASDENSALITGCLVSPPPSHSARPHLREYGLARNHSLRVLEDCEDLHSAFRWVPHAPPPKNEKKLRLFCLLSRAEGSAFVPLLARSATCSHICRHKTFPLQAQQICGLSVNFIKMIKTAIFFPPLRLCALKQPRAVSSAPL